jgi:RNA polymerase sigma-70 factor, ECF subfamily
VEPVERDWIARAQHGDLPAFEQLVIRHDGYLMRIIQNMVHPAAAEDIYQETFIKAFTSLASFREESEFRTWLTRIAINQCLNYRRGQRWKRWITLQADMDEEELAMAEMKHPEMAPDQQAVRQEMWDHLSTALDALPDTQRAAFILKYVQGCTIREVAAIMGKAEGTIKSDLFRAMQKIKLQMQQIYA